MRVPPIGNNPYVFLLLCKHEKGQAPDNLYLTVEFQKVVRASNANATRNRLLRHVVCCQFCYYWKVNVKSSCALPCEVHGNSRTMFLPSLFRPSQYYAHLLLFTVYSLVIKVVF